MRSTGGKGLGMVDSVKRRGWRIEEIRIEAARVVMMISFLVWFALVMLGAIVASTIVILILDHRDTRKIEDEIKRRPM